LGFFLREGKFLGKWVLEGMFFVVKKLGVEVEKGGKFVGEVGVDC
jgi:hypothetical protein